jgi:hypothetical protein
VVVGSSNTQTRPESAAIRFRHGTSCAITRASMSSVSQRYVTSDSASASHTRNPANMSSSLSLDGALVVRKIIPVCLMGASCHQTGKLVKLTVVKYAGTLRKCGFNVLPTLITNPSSGFNKSLRTRLYIQFCVILVNWVSTLRTGFMPTQLTGADAVYFHLVGVPCLRQNLEHTS